MNKENQIWEITKKGIEGKIDWVKGLKERVHLLRGIDYDTCVERSEERRVGKECRSRWSPYH